MKHIRLTSPREKLAIVLLCQLLCSSVFAQKAVGIFEGHTDVGTVLHAGSATYNAGMQQYQLSGSGTNIWFDHDEFQYLWKRVKGNFLLQVRGILSGKGTDPH